MNRQAAAMPKPSVAADLHQSFNVEIDLAPQITFDDEMAVDVIADTRNFLVGQVANPGLGDETDGIHDLAGSRPADPMDIGQ